MSNGGSNVLDYQISYDQGKNIYVVLATEVISQSYIANSLTPGLTYKFKV